MKQSLPTVALALAACGFLCVSRAQIRDPFWPIGENPTVPTPTPVPDIDPSDAEPQPAEPRELTDEELREQARQLSQRISDTFTRSKKAVMVANGNIYAHVGKKHLVSSNPWVTQGDEFVIELQGIRYRMKVVTLTRNHIELEPHRVSATTP